MLSRTICSKYKNGINNLTFLFKYTNFYIKIDLYKKNLQ